MRQTQALIKKGAAKDPKLSRASTKQLLPDSSETSVGPSPLPTATSAAGEDLPDAADASEMLSKPRE